MAEIEATIRQILVERVRLDPAAVAACGAETPLLGKGIGLDSVEALGLASGIEEQFNLIIADEELTPATFSNLGALAAFVRAKIAAPGRR